MQLQQRSLSISRQQIKSPAMVSARPVSHVFQSVTCHATESQDVAASVSKRQLMSGLVGAGFASLILSSPGSATAADEGVKYDAAEYATFLGYATPPTSYGGYGGNAKEAPKYTFEYPANWKTEVPNKVEKGTQGIDGRAVNPKQKDQRAFVITLARAGEDNQSFKLTDLDSTFAGFAGADYDLQDALSSATNIERNKREVEGQLIFDYDIDSPDYRYLASVTVRQGKIFALFVRSPTRSFKASEEKLRHIVNTFKLL